MKSHNPTPNNEEYIICSAIHFHDDKEHVHQPRNIKTGYVLCGLRHHNCFASLTVLKKDANLAKMKLPKHVQGFLTSLNNFMNREEAYNLALKVGQIEHTVKGPILISEDLW